MSEKAKMLPREERDSMRLRYKRSPPTNDTVRLLDHADDADEEIARLKEDRDYWQKLCTKCGDDNVELSRQRAEAGAEIAPTKRRLRLARRDLHAARSERDTLLHEGVLDGHETRKRYMKIARERKKEIARLTRALEEKAARLVDEQIEWAITKKLRDAEAEIARLRAELQEERAVFEMIDRHFEDTPVEDVRERLRQIRKRMPEELRMEKAKSVHKTKTRCSRCRGTGFLAAGAATEAPCPTCNPGGEFRAVEPMREASKE